MTFATPLALLLLTLLGALFAPRLITRRPTVPSADAGPIRAASTPSCRVRLRWLPTALRALAVALLVVALARPREGVAVTTIPEEGIDIVAAVDVSSSMTQYAGRSPFTDRQQNKLEAAREVLGNFVRTLEGDRVGLVIFQSRALTLSPLSSDQAAIQARVRNLTSGLLEDGTAIGLGIAEAVSLLENSPARSRVVVLLTDGQNNAGEIDPLSAARVAAALGVRVYTIGFGGGAVFSDIDAAGLSRLSELTGAQYYGARSPAELVTAYAEIGALERSRVGERRFIAFREFAPIFALAAVGLLVLEAGLRATWLRRLA